MPNARNAQFYKTFRAAAAAGDRGGGVEQWTSSNYSSSHIWKQIVLNLFTICIQIRLQFVYKFFYNLYTNSSTICIQIRLQAIAVPVAGRGMQHQQEHI